MSPGLLVVPKTYAEAKLKEFEPPTCFNPPHSQPACNPASSNAPTPQSWLPRLRGHLNIETDAIIGTQIQIYVEDKVVHEIEKMAPQASGSAPSGTKWDGTDWRSTGNPDYVWVNNAWNHKPAGMRWDGTDWRSTGNPDYVWVASQWVSKKASGR
ncbi:hypothetical protein PtrCC142_011655 [Pyrenophora tritici-repentis]|nr:hypothetical protein PtrCC142_011655 [Pyrenophora tritici-repentis]